MPNTSATGGYLLSNSSPSVLDGDALIDYLHDWLAGVTGYPNENVRPRWQPEPPNIPLESVDWMAFGITSVENDTWLYESHVGVGNGYDETRRHRILHAVASFYGPNADLFFSAFADGMQISQNLDALTSRGINLVKIGASTHVPELIKQKYMDRIDLPFSLKQQIIRNYPVLNIASSEIDISNGNWVDVVQVHNP